jgi:hypothetical protein
LERYGRERAVSHLSQHHCYFRQMNTYVLRHGIKGDIDHNKLIYVSMILYEGASGKKPLTGKSASAKLFAVSPLVSVSPRDFLGIFPGKLRYMNGKQPGAIQGPVQGLWLDRSEVKGKFHWVKTAKARESSNIFLLWERVNETKGDKTFCDKTCPAFRSAHPSCLTGSSG